MDLEVSKRICERYGEAIELCARDAEVLPNAVCVLYQARRSKNRIFFIGTESSGDEPIYVLKVNRREEVPDRWSSEREYEGLKFVFDNMNCPPDYGCVRPVGYGLAPQFLISCYQSGRAVLPFINHAARLCSSANHRMDAESYARRMGVWLRMFRTSEVRHGDGIDADAYVSFCSDRAVEIAGIFRKSDLMKDTMARIEGYLGDAKNDNNRLLNSTFPTHNDFWAQNFYADETDMMYPMDMEAFAFEPLNNDLFWFRSRLEWKYMLGKGKRGVWESFWDGYGRGDEGLFSLLSYLYRLLQDMAWKGRGEYRRGRGVRTSIKDRIWFIRRLSWLRGLPVGVEEACEYFGTRL